MLRSLPPGARVVVRSRIPGGFTDAIGTILDCTAMDCTLRTRRGDVVLPLRAVVLAKPVPEPPVRRPRPAPPG